MMKFVNMYDHHEMVKAFYDFARTRTKNKEKICLVNIEALMKFSLFIIFDKEKMKIITPNSEIIVEKEDIHVRKDA